jgi:hypothetical protein
MLFNSNSLKVELFCIKDFQKSDIVSYKEGETYIGVIENDNEFKEDFWIVYPHDVPIPNHDYNYQIFNYKSIMTGLPCIEEYFITRHELREEQIKSVIDD